MRVLPRALVMLLVATLTATGCQRAGSAATPAVRSTTGIQKVLLIAEENHSYAQIIGSRSAPYLNELASEYGSATHFDAGYPTGCPSLAAYILMTSGSTAGICDDRAPRHHPLTGDNVFRQVAAAGLNWRDYAESAPGPCALSNSADGRYLVRHVPPTYYVPDRAACVKGAVPMGTVASGALHDDIAAGSLPAFGFVSPDACDDMHGAPPCPADMIGGGDRWLKGRLPAILAGPDYRAGKLAIIITWDEGTGTDNHIPTLVIAPPTRKIAATETFSHCSTLRTVEELLGLPLLGCAASAASMVKAFRL
jgi:phospholipase C